MNPIRLDNVDYNDIKHLIKARTTRGQAQAISIPGRSDEDKALKDFEDELFTELFEQHHRIGLFVLSKSGEIERRLSV
ncbi:MAG: hypothetical protein M1812_007754 [Candelaria pacifica]|nr:MAG: hypothetical protein M1812_007754 [Candelaria pacifica]